MKLVVIRPIIYKSKVYKPNAPLDIPDAKGALLIKQKMAIPAEDFTKFLVEEKKKITKVELAERVIKRLTTPEPVKRERESGE